MSSPDRCPNCGSRLVDRGLLGGQCPGCLFDLAEMEPEDLTPLEPVSARLSKITLGPPNPLTPGLHGVPLQSTGTPFAVGTMINERYRIEALVGWGGMGFVYRASDALHPKRAVALKAIRSDVLSLPALERFKEEFRTMASLRHPNVARVYDFEAIRAARGEQLICMEFLDGRDALTATGGASLQVLLDIVVQICRALSYVHSRGIIHFDLKPSNVWVCEDGTVKVLDFGIAGPMPAGIDTVFGTPHYMAPEVLQQASRIDHRADLYSLGVTAYELLCRRRPHDGLSLDHLLRRQLSGAIRFPVDVIIPDWLQRTVAKLCAPDPEGRFRTANEVIAAISVGAGESYELETRETKESYILSSRFVGREEIYERVLAFVRQRIDTGAPSRRPSAAAFFVGAPSGMGKSRLFREVRHHLQLGRALFVEANCYEGGVSEYAPIVEAVQQLQPYLSAAGAVALFDRYGPEIAKLVPRFARSNRVTPSSRLANPEHERNRLLAAITGFLVEAAEVVPYVLYINDLQWAQPATAAVIERVAGAAAQRQAAPMALLGSYRNDELPGRAFEPVLERLREQERLLDEQLEPLEEADVETILRSMLGVAELPRAFFERLAAETGGNPYFLQELVRGLIDSGTIFLSDTGWRTAQRIDQLHFPESVAAAFRQRLERLSPELRGLLDPIALYGRPVEHALIEALHDGDDAALETDLASLRKRGLLVASPSVEGDARHNLAHDTMRETVFADIDGERRSRLHHALAVAIERCFAGGLDAYLGDLAHHFRGALVRDKACFYALLAADQARAVYANARAIEHYEHALELLGPDAEAEREGIRDALAELHSLSGNYDDAEVYLDELARAAKGALQRARIEHRRGTIAFQKGELARAADITWRAAELLGERRPASRRAALASALTSLSWHLVLRACPWLLRPANDDATRAVCRELSEIYMRLGYIQYFSDPFQVLMPNMRAYVFSRRSADVKQRAHNTNGLGMVYASMNLMRASRTAGIDGLAQSEHARSNWHIANANNFLGDVEVWVGDLDSSLRHNERGRDLFLDCGDMFELGNTIYHIQEAHYCRGDFQRVIDEGERHLHLLERTGSKMVAKSLHLAIGRARALLGEFDEGERQCRLGAEECDASNDRLMGSIAHTCLAEVYLAHGDYDRAVAECDVLRELRQKHWVLLYYSAFCYRLKARALVEKARCRPLAERAALLARVPSLLRRASLQHRFFRAHRAPTLVTRAIYLQLRGRARHAIRLLRESIAGAEAYGTKYWLADAHEQTARVLFESGAPRDEIAPHVERALTLFAECGATTQVDRVKSAAGPAPSSMKTWAV